MLLLGIDIGTSFIKVSVVDAATQKCIAVAQYPETENPITIRYNQVGRSNLLKCGGNIR